MTLKGLATNGAGVGVGCNASSFGKHKLQALLEINADSFFGDKTYFINSSTGKGEKHAAAYSIKAGPQCFVLKNIAVSITYGVAWYTIHDFKYSKSDALKYSATGFFGAKKHFVTQVFFTHVSTTGEPIMFLGLTAGYRF